MPYANKEDARAYAKKHYEANKAAYIARSAANRNKTREAYRQTVRRVRNGDITNQAKVGGCSQCGEKRIACLDLHHVDPSTKLYTIAVCVSNVVSKQKLLDEIAKCIVLCANCHRCLHYEERQAQKVRSTES